MENFDGYKISRWERIFGGDFWILRNIGRALTLFFFLLIPVRRWRRALHDQFDVWIISFCHKKISYFVSQYPKVRLENETIKDIAEKKCSISRFGDGEFNMCIGRNKSFQKYDKELVSRLRSILASNETGLMVGIPTIRSVEDLSVIMKKFVIRRGHRVLKLLDQDRIYESSTITTVFPEDSAVLERHVALLKSIWTERKVLFVVGKESRFFFEKELFDNISQYKFLYGPAVDAYAEYNDLLKRITSYDKSWLVMISLGPTATVMACDLFKLGYQAIDLGQTPSKFHRAKYGKRYPIGHKMYDGKRS